MKNLLNKTILVLSISMGLTGCGEFSSDGSADGSQAMSKDSTLIADDFFAMNQRLPILSVTISGGANCTETICDGPETGQFAVNMNLEPTEDPVTFKLEPILIQGAVIAEPNVDYSVLSGSDCPALPCDVSFAASANPQSRRVVIRITPDAQNESAEEVIALSIGALVGARLHEDNMAFNYAVKYTILDDDGATPPPGGSTLPPYYSCGNPPDGSYVEDGKLIVPLADGKKGIMVRHMNGSSLEGINCGDGSVVHASIDQPLITAGRLWIHAWFPGVNPSAPNPYNTKMSAYMNGVNWQAPLDTIWFELNIFDATSEVDLGQIGRSPPCQGQWKRVQPFRQSDGETVPSALVCVPQEVYDDECGFVINYDVAKWPVDPKTLEYYPFAGGTSLAPNGCPSYTEKLKRIAR